MRFEKEFTVAAPLDQAWRELDDIEVLASCLPGELRNADGVRTGEFSLAENEATRCQATLRPVDNDEDEHATTVRVTARQIGGPAIGAGTIACRASANGDSTHVALGAEITLTGHSAPTEVIEQRGQELIEQIAERLRDRLLVAPPVADDDAASHEAPPSIATAAPATHEASPIREPEPALAQSAPEDPALPRYVLAGAMAALALLVFRAVRARRMGAPAS
jgi:carbon monoxide dehydrogenase subunit G